MLVSQLQTYELKEHELRKSKAKNKYVESQFANNSSANRLAWILPFELSMCFTFCLIELKENFSSFFQISVLLRIVKNLALNLGLTPLLHLFSRCSSVKFMA